MDESDAFLLDVTPLSLRIGVAGGLAETVIERNTPVPIEQSRTFTTYQDYQESVQIKVFQGESRKASENELLGQFEFGGFKKARRGEVQIEVAFEINSDGLVKVKACDEETGQQAETTITLASGLSEEDMKTILESSPADRVDTASAADVGEPEDEVDLVPLDTEEPIDQQTEAELNDVVDPNADTGTDTPALATDDEDLVELDLDENLFGEVGVDLTDLNNENE